MPRYGPVQGFFDFHVQLCQRKETFYFFSLFFVCFFLTGGLHYTKLVFTEGIADSVTNLGDAISEGSDP